jgi:acetolactate synthase I/II/III large subunit
VQKYRPLVILGAGIHLSGAEEEAREYVHKFKIPVCLTWGALDLFPSDDPLVVGGFGTHGTRYGNFAVQNASDITAIGTRLDSKATGTPIESFARRARVFMVDIDIREIEKFKDLKRIIGVAEDAKHFLKTNIESGVREPAPQEWLDQIKVWKEKYPIVRPEYYKEEGINPYVFIETLSSLSAEDEIICTDTGCAVAWVSQAWKWKKRQRFIHAFNQTPMGYGLPAAIGSHYATDKRVILVTGDGSLMMSIGELATVAGHKLPIKIFMFNNQGHGMCRQTQREWLGATYPSTSLEGGLTFPEFRAWAIYAGESAISTRVCDKVSNPGLQLSLTEVIEEELSSPGPSFVEIKIHPDHDVVPKVKYGHSNEDAHPLLSREELKAQMICES